MMKATNLNTISDYKKEAIRIEKIIRKSSKRAKGQWCRYLKRLLIEISYYENSTINYRYLKDL